MAWISIHEQVKDHHKLRDLAKLLKSSRQEALGILVMLWLWGINNADRDGCLCGSDARDIADGIIYRATAPEHLIECLIKSKWLDQSGDQYIIHDWDIWQTEWFKALDKRAENTARVREYRARQKQQSENCKESTSYGNDYSNDTKEGYVIPSPSPSDKPSPSPSDKPSKEKVIMHEADESAPCCTLSLNDGTEYTATESQVKKWKSLYPAVDVMQELRNMQGWCDANPARRKTKAGIKRFINAWLAKEQNENSNAKADPILLKRDYSKGRSIFDD